MLAYLRKQKASPRKFRLLAAASCREIWEQLPTAECRAVVEAAEEWADGVLSQKKLLFARQPAERVAQRLSNEARELEPGAGTATWVQRARDYEAAMAAVEAAQLRVDLVQQSLWYARSCERVSSRSAMLAKQSHLGERHLRQSLPAHSLRSRMASAWIRRLPSLRTMYESRDFSAMPILADAIQDAGAAITTPSFLPCRTEQMHVRGCWVVDLVLGAQKLKVRCVWR